MLSVFCFDWELGFFGFLFHCGNEIWTRMNKRSYTDWEKRETDKLYLEGSRGHWKCQKTNPTLSEILKFWVFSYCLPCLPILHTSWISLKHHKVKSFRSDWPDLTQLKLPESLSNRSCWAIHDAADVQWIRPQSSCLRGPIFYSYTDKLTKKLLRIIRMKQIFTFSSLLTIPSHYND